MEGIVLIFDFDKTIIDCDSDEWVVGGLGGAALLEELLPTLPLNTLMVRMMSYLHSQGKTIQDISDCLKTVPIDPQIISAIKTAYVLGCELRIVSDANTFFIETILSHHGLLECFSEINTNPSFIDDDGKLRILPFHDFHSSSHGCTLCPPNMCKGLIVERIKESILQEGKRRIVYLGDGKGDYCPSLKLVEGDFVMPRKNYPAWELITSNPLMIKAEVCEWGDAEEMEEVLLKLINMVLLSAQEERNFQAMPRLPHEAFQQVLRVPH
ncbi:Inorganic pyrophosphatase 2 [Acorus gramineus]|uniref:Inorganic pyrophosphatase 2 n=1 Tax=Acorus gramineus TaxID=55184 RepID=A0AAV9AMX8_ACOGR|nr:Inorganic pyrophosphatase 2 [Acorus gramineus]